MSTNDQEQAYNWRQPKSRAQKLALQNPNIRLINVSFFEPLSELANTIKNLVRREGDKRFPGSTMSADIAVMLNQLRVTFNLLRFLNADERRDNDPYYRIGYSFVSLPLIRNLIDGLYNITVLLDEPSKARTFRLSGYKRMFDAIDESEKLYREERGWPEYISQLRASTNAGLRADGFLVQNLTERPKWMLLGTYLNTDPTRDSEHKTLMRRLVHGPWREYSEISHSTFSGLRDLFAILNVDDVDHQHRPGILQKAERQLTQHLGRAATIVLAVCTEVQAAYCFKGHSVNPRIHRLWQEMITFPEGKDMYNIRYKALLHSRIQDVPAKPL